VTTTAVGHQAERAACEELVRRGYIIIARNWRTRVCEIDIIAQKDDCLHFVEVKYRSHERQGSGLEYITPAKLRQMRFAAEQWLHEYEWHGDTNLAAIEVCAPDFAISEFVESIQL